MDKTPASLLERLRRPDEGAWPRFVELYTPLLYFWACRTGLQAADAADLVQDVFTLLLQKFPAFSYDRNKSFRSWLRTVTLNRLHDNRRRKAAALRDAGPAGLEEVAVPPDAEALWDKEYRDHLVGRAAELMKAEFQPTTWQAFWGLAVEGKSGGRGCCRPGTECRGRLRRQVARVAAVASGTGRPAGVIHAPEGAAKNSRAGASDSGRRLRTLSSGGSAYRTHNGELPMKPPSACPGVELLERYAVGRTSEAEAQRLEEHLKGCLRCLACLPSLGEDDRLVRDLRAQKNKPRPESAVLDRLQEQLRGLRPPAATTLSADTNSPDRNATPSTVESSAAEEDVRALLAPAQGPDEIGRLGPYGVLGVLGKGGMGIIFEVEDPQLRRRIALKAIRPTLAGSSDARQRFRHEAQRMASLTHDHILAVYHIGEDRGVLFLAMPLLRGESLEDRLRREGRLLPLAELLRIGRETAQGLAAAHARGVIHRDVKPANLWLEAPTGRIKILDFGLARLAEGDTGLTGSGALVGTPSYMAPEQAEGQVDHRADLFSLGCVLYQMATGRLAFPGRTRAEILHAVATRNPTPPRQINPETPERLSQLIERLLSKDRADRPDSAGIVVQALEEIEREACVQRPLGECALDGTDLGKLTKRLGRWPVAEACEAVRQAAVGLQHTHERGLVHRDIKPANLWLTPAGEVKVLDLGLARLCDHGESGSLTRSGGGGMGTADYIAPEQVLDSHTADIRADLYSLGCTLFHLLIGEPPFGNSSHPTIGRKHEAHLKEPPRSVRQCRPDVPAELAEVVMRLLAKRPEDRYAMPGEVAAALAQFAENARLERLLDGSGDVGPLTEPYEGHYSPSTRITKRGRNKNRRWVLLTLGAAATVFALGFLGRLAHKGEFPTLSQDVSPPQVEPSDPPAEYESFLDAILWNPNAPDRHKLRLRSTPNWPITRGDQVRIEARLNRPGYVYILWIDPQGRGFPLYPWNPGRWNRDPGEEKPVAEIKTPGGQGWHVPRGRPGLVTVFVMVCERPLPLDVDAELARWMAPKDQAPKLIMFENGMEVQQGKDHLPQIIDQIEHGNPRQRARRIQDLLKTKLQRNYKNSWAMAFDHPGS